MQGKRCAYANEQTRRQFKNRKQRCAVPRFACFCFLLLFLLSRVKMISNLNFLSFEFWNLKLHHTTKWKTKDSQECLGPGFSSEACSFFHRTKIHTRNVWAKNCFFKVAVNWFSSLFFGFGLRRLLSATETTKNQKTSNKNQKKQKKQKNQRILRNVWAKDFVQRHWFFCFFCFFLVFLEFFWFWAPEAFIGYWDYQKNQKTSNKNQKNQKNQRILRNVWAKDFVQRHWFFCFFCFFWFSSSFFGFGLRKLLSATKTTKNSKTSKKPKKLKKTKKNKGFWGMSGPRTLFRGIVFVWFSSSFFGFWLNPKKKGLSGMCGKHGF